MKKHNNSIGLIWIPFLTALLFRLLYWQQASDNPLLYVPLVDEEFYVDYARSLFSDSSGTGIQSFYMDPLYAYFLRATFFLFDGSLLAPRILQILLDSFAASLLFLIGVRLWSVRSGLVAGLIYAAYPIAWFYSLTLLKSTLTTDYLVLYLYLFLLLQDRTQEARLPVKWLFLGLLAGIGVYLRGYLVLLIPASMLVALLIDRDRIRHFLHKALPYAAGALMVFTIAGMTNLVNHGRFAVLVGNSGITLYSANNADNPQGGYSKPSFISTNHPASLYQQYKTEAERQLNRRLEPNEVSAYWRDQAFAYWTSDVLALPCLLLNKLLNLITHEEVANNLSFRQAAQFAPMLLPDMPFYTIILALGLPGILLANLQDRRSLTLLVTPMVILITSLLFYSSSRFRFPMVPVLALGSAYLLTMPWYKRRGMTRLILIGLTPALFIASLFTKGPPVNPHQGDLNLAIAYIRLGEADNALATLENKEAVLGHLASYHRIRGLAAMVLKEYPRAYQYSLHALAIHPNDRTALHNAAISAMELRKYHEALALFNKAYHLSKDAEYLYWLGKTEHLLGNNSKSKEYLLTAIRMLPQSSKYQQAAQQLLQNLR